MPYPAEFTTTNFRDYVNEAGLPEYAHAASRMPYEKRQFVFSGIMAKALDRFSSSNKSKDVYAQVSILGQEHNSEADFTAARNELRSSHNAEILFERDGVLHPEFETVGHELLETAKHPSNNNNPNQIVTENKLCFDNDGKQIYLPEVERSWLTGAYLAMSIANNPMPNRVVIFGDNHCQEIQNSLRACLAYLGVDAAQVEIKYQKSQGSMEASPPNALTLTADTMRDSKAIITAEGLSACLDASSVVTAESSTPVDEFQKYIESHYQDNIAEISEFITEQAKACEIEETDLKTAVMEKLNSPQGNSENSNDVSSQPKAINYGELLKIIDAAGEALFTSKSSPSAAP